MARYTGPTTRISRRFGQLILGSGKAFERRAYPAGQHGAKLKRKVSEYAVGLNEKQKLRYTYGLLERQFRRTFEIAKKERGVTGERFLQLLETRLDSTVYLLGLAKSRAADIQADANITIVNPEQVICTLDTKRTFEAEIEIKTGRGYHPGEANKKEEQAIGVISIDSLFSPVRLVKYAVEATRVGQITDYDKLVLEVWTDGRITPDDALKQSASILKHHLDVFDRVSEEAFEFESQQSEVSEEQNKLRKLLNMSVNEIELSVRAANCLNNANITTVGELAMKTEQEMLKYRNFGKKSLNEIKEKLEALGLSLGMKFDERLLDTKKEG